MGLASPASRALQRHALAAHASLDGGASVPRAGADTGAADVRAGGPLARLRPVVQDSWLRSLRYHRDPASAAASPWLSGQDLAGYVRAHPLAGVLPVIDRLLLQPARDTGLLVAVGDEFGRLLWVEGDPAVRRKAEAMAFLAGTDWSERAVGTSAPGTALATGQGIQVSGAEHFSPRAHRWSCTAVPIHDPDTGALLGVVDLTGNEDAVATHSLSLVRAAVAAAEAELRLHRLAGDRAEPARLSSRPAAPTAAPPAGTGGAARIRQAGAAFACLGNDGGILRAGGLRLALGGRHTEIVTLLAWHRRGLDSGELAALLFGEHGQEASLRAELVRLRRVLAGREAAVGVLSRPYRLAPGVALDARNVMELLAAGRHRQALGAYRGPVLPRSSAPGIEDIRAEVSGALREAILADADPDVVMDYLDLPEAARDAQGLRTALQVLPARSPRRAVVVARLDLLEAALR